MALSGAQDSGVQEYVAGFFRRRMHGLTMMMTMDVSNALGIGLSGCNHVGPTAETAEAVTEGQDVRCYLEATFV